MSAVSRPASLSRYAYAAVYTAGDGGQETGPVLAEVYATRKRAAWRFAPVEVATELAKVGVDLGTPGDRPGGRTAWPLTVVAYVSARPWGQERSGSQVWRVPARWLGARGGEL